MTAPTPPAPTARNPKTQSAHRRDSVWQILLPVGLAALAAVVLMVMAAQPGFRPELSAWADVSLVFLILPNMLLGLALLALVGGVAYGAAYLHGYLPPYFKQAQDFLAVVAHRAARYSQKVSGLILSIRSALAAGQSVARQAQGLLRPGPKK